MPDGFTLDPAQLTAAGGDLDAAAAAVGGTTAGVRVAPDAGGSSEEVRKAFERLASGVEAVARSLTGAAGGLEETLATYQDADAGAAGAYDGVGGR